MDSYGKALYASGELAINWSIFFILCQEIIRLIKFK